MRKCLIFAGLLLGAIATSGMSSCQEKQQPARAALLGCESIQTSLDILYPLRKDGKLTTGQTTLIDRMRSVSDPYCLGPAPDVNSSVTDVAIDGAARTLGSLVADVAAQ